MKVYVTVHAIDFELGVTRAMSCRKFPVVSLETRDASANHWTSTCMNCLTRVFFILGAIIGLAVASHATVLVNDSWQDGSRTDPASPTYSENGTNLDPLQDTDLESAWFNGGTGASATATPGHLNLAMGSSSASWTTYFTPEASPVTLASAGDALKATWIFTPTNVNVSNTSQNFRLALADAPSRLSSDGSPPSAAYKGYAMFMNMGQTLGNSNPFQLREWNTSSDDLLAASGAWAALANGATSGNHGYDSLTQYTFVMTLTRNASSGLDIVATMTGGTLNGSGTATVSFTDTSPSSFTYDTFGLRPSNAASTADKFDTTLFKVEFIPGATAPAIDADPEDQTILVGQNALFSVSASGTLPLYYQWYFNTNSPINSATNFSMVVTNAQLADAGGYSVLVSNSYGSVTSAVAQLTINPPVAPSIITHPQDQTVSPGATAAFSVVAGGSTPLSYQWYYNDTTPVANVNDSTLTITNVQIANGGNYSVLVSNVAGSALSSNAVLAVNTNPVAPVFTSQPGSQVVLIGGVASFSAVAAGTAPINYQWKKGGVPISGAASSSLTLTNVQISDAGTYAVTASNSVGVATSSNAFLTVTTAVPVANSAYNLVGFAQGTTGGGVIPDTDPNYRKVTNAVELKDALGRHAGVKVIEIMNDLDLGYNEIPAAAKAESEPFRPDNTPVKHPVLIASGVSLLDIQDLSNLTIFSTNGATIRHSHWNIKRCDNLIIRNLKFDELWEWDEATKGDYDSKNWDFMTVGDGGACDGVWIDHCEFTKCYDGVIDIKGGSQNITISWCRFTGDDGSSNSFVRQQFNYLEANPSGNTMYNFLRANGFTVDEIVDVQRSQKKGLLIGVSPDDYSVTIHHDYFKNMQDRMPRLRGGNVHVYNMYVENTEARAAKLMRNDKVSNNATLDGKLNDSGPIYKFDVVLNGAISTEGGAVLVEKSQMIDLLWPLRNNQTDPDDPTFTGKIKGLDIIYQLGQTVFRGDSTIPYNDLGPKQAPIIAFSWNLPGNQLPYSYNTDDPTELPIMLAGSPGAGAGRLTWAKTNWLMTAYPPTTPNIVVDPQSQTVTNGQSATFSVVAGGSSPLRYQWYFNTSSPIASATNTVLTINSVQASDAGTYSVIVSNTAGTATSALATLSISSPATPFQDWQTLYFGCTDCLQAAATADPDGDGMNNEAEFLSGTNPTDSTSALRIISAAQQGTNVVISWTTGGGRTNAVQATAGDASGSYSTNFINLSGLIVIPSNDMDVATNYVDVGGATNTPARYYRIRLVP